jgi:hypothetical protein
VLTGVYDGFMTATTKRRTERCGLHELRPRTKHGQEMHTHEQRQLGRNGTDDILE